MYGEPFAVPVPDRLVFVWWFEGGGVCYSGCRYHHGNRRILYFRPGNAIYPVYEEPVFQKVLDNAVQWATPHTDGSVSPDSHAADTLSD